MKTIALIACVFVIGTASAATKQVPVVANLQRFEIGGIIEGFIDEIIKDLAYFDPTHIDELYLNFLWLKAGFKNFHFEGFSNIDSNISIDVGLVTKIQTSFGMNRVFGSVELWESNFPFIYGNGTAGFNINNVYGGFQVKYDLFNGFSPSIVVTSIGNAEAYVTGVLNDEVFSQEITDGMNNFLNNVVNSPEFHQMLEYYVDSFLSVFLREVIQMKK